MAPGGGPQIAGSSQWMTSTVNAVIVLDQPGTVFTNLDEISGRVIVRTAKSVDISSIVVKLEGESRTRLMSVGGPVNEKPRPKLEYHKVLYRMLTVFPPADLLQNRLETAPKLAYTLPAGHHEYPFSFKIPFNNSCHADAPPHTPVSLFLSSLELSRTPTSHVKRTLPPTLTGFPGEAEVRYFVKVTVGRQSFFKENPRAYIPFTFVPIEPPRKPPSGSEIFARQKHTFVLDSQDLSSSTKIKAMFGKRASITKNQTAEDALQVSIDARLPEGAILTCNSTIPLRLLLKRHNSSGAAIHLDSLQISLIGHTSIRAHDIHRIASTSWVLLSKSNMNMLISAASDAAGTDIILDDSIWRSLKLANTIAPSFTTCNIARSYQLDIRAGLSCTSGADQMSYTISKPSSRSKSTSVILPLRLNATIYSGIAPPSELLQRMAHRKSVPTPSVAVPSDSKTGSSQVSTPLEADQSDMHSDSIPEADAEDRAAQYDQELVAPPKYSEAPPSYEDAIASELKPISAPRPDYAPPLADRDHLLNPDR